MAVTSRVFRFENHDDTYRTWRNAGVSGRTVVHVDAHHDMSWRKPRHAMSIGNYLSTAIVEKMVSAVYWVVPDPGWDLPGSRRAALRHVRHLVRKYPRPRSRVVVSQESIRTQLLGVPLHVCPLRHMPALHEPVLLDFDTDFMVIPKVSYRESDTHVESPWIWPQEAVEMLRRAGVNPDLVTIAYSVEGGFTPLVWKHLGDEVALQFETSPDTGRARAFALMRQADDATRRGATSEAALLLGEAARAWPMFAAPHHWLARLGRESGDLDSARASWRRALDLDRSYRTAFNSAGRSYYDQRRLDEAACEFYLSLALDPGDAFALLGLGLVARRRNRPLQAKAFLMRALAADASLPDAERELGTILAQEGRTDEAIAAYERALKLTLAGHLPVAASSFSQEEQRWMDPHHAAVHLALAALHARRGDLTRAINGYRLGIAMEADSFGPRCRLAWLHCRTLAWRKALVQVGHALRRAPVSLKHTLQHWKNRVLWGLAARRAVADLD